MQKNNFPQKRQEYQLEIMLHYNPNTDLFIVFKVTVHHMSLLNGSEE
jgi:hypothetical protein